MTIILYLLVIAFLLSFPSETASAALSAMHVWATSIVPVLFPYMVFGRLLGKSLHMLNLPGSPAAAALGLLGGSPTGAALITSYASRLSSRSILSLCTLTGTISPMFILGTIQTWINNPSLCKKLLVCHWLSACAGAWIVHRLHHSNGNSDAMRPVAMERAAFCNPITQSIEAIIQVGGCVILYSVLARIGGILLQPFFPQLQPALHAALEVAGGINAICQSSLSPDAKGFSLSIALGFTGFSILSQNHAMLRPLGLRFYQLVILALLRAALSALFFFLVSFFF